MDSSVDNSKLQIKNEQFREREFEDIGQSRKNFGGLDVNRSLDRNKSKFQIKNSNGKKSLPEGKFCENLQQQWSKDFYRVHDKEITDSFIFEEQSGFRSSGSSLFQQKKKAREEQEENVTFNSGSRFKTSLSLKRSQIKIESRFEQSEICQGDQKEVESLNQISYCSFYDSMYKFYATGEQIQSIVGIDRSQQKRNWKSIYEDDGSKFEEVRQQVWEKGQLVNKSRRLGLENEFMTLKNTIIEFSQEDSLEDVKEFEVLKKKEEDEKELNLSIGEKGNERRLLVDVRREVMEYEMGGVQGQNILSHQQQGFTYNHSQMNFRSIRTSEQLHQIDKLFENISGKLQLAIDIAQNLSARLSKPPQCFIQQGQQAVEFWNAFVDSIFTMFNTVITPDHCNLNLVKSLVEKYYSSIQYITASGPFQFPKFLETVFLLVNQLTTYFNSTSTQQNHDIFSPSVFSSLKTQFLKMKHCFQSNPGLFQFAILYFKLQALQICKEQLIKIKPDNQIKIRLGFQFLRKYLQSSNRSTFKILNLIETQNLKIQKTPQACNQILLENIRESLLPLQKINMKDQYNLQDSFGIINTLYQLIYQKGVFRLFKS